MDINTLLSLSPLDGRYEHHTRDLRECGSEFGLIHARLEIEVRWFIFLAQQASVSELPKLTSNSEQFLMALVEQFDLNEAQAIKEIEQTTNHDVKAIEYYLHQKLASHPELKSLTNFIHFACTSEDINNLAYALMLKKLRAKSLGALQAFMGQLETLIQDNVAQPLLSLTHGQTASPTTLGKEMRNVTARLERQVTLLTQQPILGKINGAVGNFNAHVIAYPEVDWLSCSKSFVESLDLTWNPLTTQIEPHDAMAEIFDTMGRINTILIDFSRDVWGYISRGIFTQKLKDGEVGSSTMPHKVNPIDFENAEGNLGLANAMFGFLARKLPRSRFQRDLTDSTVQRNIGVAFGYHYLALKSLQKGLSKLTTNRDAMNQQLAQAWETLGEAIQTVMRRYGHENPYEKLKTLTRGKTITQESLQTFIESLDIPNDAKQRLLALTPSTYLGLAEDLANFR